MQDLGNKYAMERILKFLKKNIHELQLTSFLPTIFISSSIFSKQIIFMT